MCRRTKWRVGGWVGGWLGGWVGDNLILAHLEELGSPMADALSDFAGESGRSEASDSGSWQGASEGVLLCPFLI